MTSEVVIDVQEKEISIALLEDKRLVEYQNEPRTVSYSVGNIYVAKVKKLMPGLNACFVDVGYERDAFLHYLDLGSQFHSFENISNKYRATVVNSTPLLKPRAYPTLKRMAAYKIPSRWAKRFWYKSLKNPSQPRALALLASLALQVDISCLYHLVKKYRYQAKLKAARNAHA